MSVINYKHCVNVLIYGDYPELADRCLKSLKHYMEPNFVGSIRIALNNPGKVSKDLALDYFNFASADDRHKGIEIIVAEVEGENPAKYPIMRKLIYGEDFVNDYRLFMWFDDDSFLQASDIFSTTSKQFELNAQYGVMGSRKSVLLQLGQDDYIRDQPWYNGKSVSSGRRQAFIAGGWWVASQEFLKSIDYPFKELHHRGGDVMLGAAAKQQDMHCVHNELGVKVNASEGQESHKSPRRGIMHEKPIGIGYPHSPILPVNHDFGFKIIKHSK